MEYVEQKCIWKGVGVKVRNILIWGTGQRGQEAFRAFSQYTELYNIIAFGDNDKNQIGKTLFGKPVWGINMLKQSGKIDCIFVASSASKEIREQLEKVVAIPSYDDMTYLILERMSIDISGFCNAKCKWCVTGRRNRKGQGIRIEKYMHYDLFVQIYEYLVSKVMIVPDTDIMLYSWGEPLLNPDYKRIVEFLAEKGQKFSVSTNASVAPLADKADAYRGCTAFTFSMPGFSQQSYDQIHQLSFERVRENIKRITENIYSHGFQGDGSLSWHVYKFNMHEMEAAREFAKSLNLRFHAYYPYFNGLSLTQKYLEGNLADEKEDIESDFYFEHVEGLLKQRPKEYECFLNTIISVDHNGRLVLCCASDDECRDYIWKPITSVTSMDDLWTLRGQMLQSDTCKMCRKICFDYWVGRNPEFTEVLCEEEHESIG